jgi:cyclopropane fatty-acyl-phospholipid synthase-like methyltransferase
VSLGPDYFDGVYAAADDPWSLASRWYERRKYAVTVAALPRERYARGLEVGCSVGVLTEQLAERCDALLALDVAASAVRTASVRTAAFPQVRVEQRRLPDAWPGGSFDLIVLSEVLYYLAAGDAAELLQRASAALEPEGTLVVVHWRHPVADYPRSGDEVHEALAADAAGLGLARTVHHEELDFLLDVYLRTPPEPRSVAQREGLA